MVGKGIIALCTALAIAAAVLLSACGSSGGSEELTKTDFVRKGNAICGKWQQARGNRFREVSSRFKPPVTQAKREKAILFILEPYEDTLQSLNELEPPSGEEQKVEAMIKAGEEAMAQGQANPGTLISSSATFTKSNELFEDYGLKECKV